jgi:hypothetical protein
MKNTRPRCETPAPLTEIEAGLPDYQRRTTIDDHAHFLRCISTDERGLDEIDREIDEDFDDLVVVDPYEVHAPSRRSDKDLGEFLSLIDSLETGNDRKEITR